MQNPLLDAIYPLLAGARSLSGDFCHFWRQSSDTAGGQYLARTYDALVDSMAHVWRATTAARPAPNTRLQMEGRAEQP